MPHLIHTISTHAVVIEGMPLEAHGILHEACTKASKEFPIVFQIVVLEPKPASAIPRQIVYVTGHPCASMMDVSDAVMLIKKEGQRTPRKDK